MAGISTNADERNDANELKSAEQALRRAEAWFVGQKEAFQAAMNGATLETSLDILIRTAIEQADRDRRCAFYRIGPHGTGLHHVVGMGDAYARRVDGFTIGPDSPSCGLAAWTGRPVMTPDVEEDPRWKPWLGLAREFNFRGCWSFPVETSAGRIVGTFAMYFQTPRIPTARDRDLIASLTHSAAIIISHDEEVQTRRRAEEHQRMLMAELDHRVKNALARVAMVAESTSHGSESIDEFTRAFKGRIQSMASAHSLLSKNRWQSIGLEALVRSQLAPYTTKENTTIGGAAVELNTACTQSVAMVLHELVTNAAKCGALSTPAGHVSVTWDCSRNGSTASTLRIIWCERGGPQVATSIESGYGTDLIRHLIPHELGGQVDLAFEPDGVNCRIEIPVAPQ